MTAALCSKEVRAARAKKAKELAKAIKAGLAVPPPTPTYLAELPRPRLLVPVGLGGATGPASKAMPRGPGLCRRADPDLAAGPSRARPEAGRPGRLGGRRQLTLRAL